MEPIQQEEQIPAEYCTPMKTACLTEDQIRKAVALYWQWFEEYGGKPNFSADQPLETLKENPELVAHVLTRAEIMGFKIRA